jgi:hypothetical protein
MNIQQNLAGLILLAASSPLLAEVKIISHNANIWYQYGNTVRLNGTASGNVTSVTWACTSGCNNSGTANGTANWRSGTIFLEAGSNNVTVTSHLSGGSTETDSINLYRTIAGSTTVNFPYTLDFDAGPSTLEAMYAASSGASVVQQTAQCWSGGCARFTPAEASNSYAALGGFQFSSNPQVVHIRYLIYFGPDYANRLDSRHKHIIIHRYGDLGLNPPADNSDDRGMIYVWHTGTGDLSMGACDNTDCRFEGGSTRPDGDESLLISERPAEWIALEAVFDSVTHTASLYATTRDGDLNELLIGQKTLHPTTNAADDYWYALSVFGAFIDLGTDASPGMYFLLDEIVMDDDHIGPPAGFIDGGVAPQPRPAAPTLLEVDLLGED